MTGHQPIGIFQLQIQSREQLPVAPLREAESEKNKELLFRLAAAKEIRVAAAETAGLYQNRTVFSH